LTERERATKNRPDLAAGRGAGDSNPARSVNSLFVRVVCVVGPMFVPFLCSPVYVAAAAGGAAS